MKLLYILKGKTPVPEPDVIKWGQWFETADRTVALNTFGDTVVSTVFLGTNHNYSDLGKSILFETCVFFNKESSEIVDRYSSWDEAEVGHKKTCEAYKQRMN